MRHVLTKTISMIVLFSLIVAACGDDDSEPEPPSEIVLLTHDSFFVSDGIWDRFEAETGLRVRVLMAGGAGAMVNQAILTKDNPIADVMFGIDNTLLTRALDEDLFIAFLPLSSIHVPDEFRLDELNRVTPIDFGDVCVNFDRNAFLEAGVPIPTNLGDLPQPAYRGRLVVQDPATSSPGLAFLLATIAAFPETDDYTWEDYWRDLVANDVLVTSGWEEAYNTHFSGSGDGDRPLVVSYASSPVAEVIFSTEPLTQAPTGVIPTGCFRQIEFAGTLTGTEAVDEAGMLIEYMLGLEFQQDIPLNMFVFPANRNAVLPPEFIEFGAGR